MRFDWSAFRYVLEAATRLEASTKLEASNRIDFVTITNAITGLCVALRDGHDLTDDQWAVATSIILRAAPEGKIIRMMRDEEIRQRVENVDRFFGTVSEVQQELAEKHEKSVDRVRKIAASQATPLAEFMAGQSPVSPVAKSAALATLTTIRRKLTAKSGKGEEFRAALCQGFGKVGKTQIAEEIHLDVERLRELGVTTKAAIKAVAEQFDENIPMVATAHKRIATKRRDEINGVVRVVNEHGAIIKDERGNLDVQTVKPGDYKI